LEEAQKVNCGWCGWLNRVQEHNLDKKRASCWEILAGHLDVKEDKDDKDDEPNEDVQPLRRRRRIGGAGESLNGRISAVAADVEDYHE
jgi:hypothetical protein